MVSKTKLITIFDPKPSVYTSRLTNLVFSKPVIRAILATTAQGLPPGVSDPINLLEKPKVESIISE